ncbi:MAG TPA: dihydrofolate reductase [Candidatus Paceibacterota bacterium]
MERPPEISIIAALSTSNRALGKNNQLLWHISEDLRRFKELTEGHPVIMGRKTFESIGKPLPNRTNIVITRNPEFRADSLLITSSFAEALSKAREREKKEIFVMGGAQIYTQALPFADKLYLTLINDKKEADTFFPAYEAEFTKETYREERETPDGVKYAWINLERG